MSLVSKLKHFYLLHFSQPAGDRPLYKWAEQHLPRSILQIGVGDAERTIRLLQAMGTKRPANEIHFTGIDLFESRPATDPTRRTLRDTYKRLKTLGLSVRLLPGDPYMALQHAANTLNNIDLVIISADQDPASLSKAWHYLPRTLHGRTQIFHERPSKTPGTLHFTPISHPERETLSRTATDLLHRRAA